MGAHLEKTEVGLKLTFNTKSNARQSKILMHESKTKGLEENI